MRPTVNAGLQRQAGALAAALGHRLAPWASPFRGSAVASCRECGLYACVESQPEGDGPIFGSAVLVECRGPGTPPIWAERIAS